MAKKKSEISRNIEVNPSYEPQDDGELEGEESGTYFDYTCTAFTVSRNENGKFDLLVIRIDEDTDQAIIEREETRYDSVSRALMDIQVRMEQELTKRGT